LFGEGVTNSQTPSASKSASNFLTQEQPDKSPKVLRHDFLKRNGYAFGASPTAIHQPLIGEFAE